MVGAHFLCTNTSILPKCQAFISLLEFAQLYILVHCCWYTIQLHCRCYHPQGTGPFNQLFHHSQDNRLLCLHDRITAGFSQHTYCAWFSTVVNLRKMLSAHPQIAIATSLDVCFQSICEYSKLSMALSICL